MNSAELVFVITYTNSAQFISGSKNLITFFGVKKNIKGDATPALLPLVS